MKTKKQKNRNIRMIFVVENWLWVSDLGTFWWPVWESVKVKSIKYFSRIVFWAKIYFRVDPRSENSTTDVTLSKSHMLWVGIFRVSLRMHLYLRCGEKAFPERTISLGRIICGLLRFYFMGPMTRPLVQ